MEILKTYKFYNKDGRRLAIFGKFLEGSLFSDSPTLQVVIIPCSKRDQFSKKVANRLYGEIDNGEVYGEIPAHGSYNVPVLNGSHKAEFLKFCNVHFYKKMIGAELMVGKQDIVLNARVKKSCNIFGHCMTYVETEVLKKKIYPNA
jgi:hypothetical protein